MNKDISIIQNKLMANLERLDNENIDLKNEVARSNAISQLANTYIKTCNLALRVDEVAERKGVTTEKLNEMLGFNNEEK